LDGLYIHGDLIVDGNTVSGTGTQIAPPGYVFTLDSGKQVQRVTVNLSGRVNTSRQDIQGTVTVLGMSGQGSLRAIASAAHRASYNNGSSFATIAGRYEDIRTGTLIDVTIGSDGSITDNNSNCTIVGSVTPIDSRFNLYELQVTVSACPVFVEGAYEGFASIDEDTGSPILITAGDNGVNALIVYIMDSI
jgi:hypothetical protein